MNTLEDIIKIVDQYYTETGRQMSTIEPGSDVKQAARIAETRFMEGLAKLEALNLSPGDRRNFSLMREAFCDVIKAMRELQRGNGANAEQYTAKSGNKALRYAQAWGGRHE